MRYNFDSTFSPRSVIDIDQHSPIAVETPHSLMNGFRHANGDSCRRRLFISIVAQKIDVKKVSSQSERIYAWNISTDFMNNSRTMTLLASELLCWFWFLSGCQNIKFTRFHPNLSSRCFSHIKSCCGCNSHIWRKEFHATTHNWIFHISILYDFLWYFLLVLLCCWLWKMWSNNLMIPLELESSEKRNEQFARWNWKMKISCNPWTKSEKISELEENLERKSERNPVCLLYVLCYHSYQSPSLIS